MQTTGPDAECNKGWYYVDTNGEKCGPVLASLILGSLFKSRAVNDNTYVWRAKLQTEWAPIKDVVGGLASRKKYLTTNTNEIERPHKSTDSAICTVTSPISASMSVTSTATTPSSTDLRFDEKAVLKRKCRIVVYTVLGDYNCTQVSNRFPH